MIKAGLIGATGYAGFEATQLLAHHPEVELTFITARADAGKRVSDLYPSPLKNTYQKVDEVDLSAVDVLFLALPHAASAEMAIRGLEAGTRVVDLSADFRLKDVNTYETWYKHTHPAPERLSDAVYGLTEWYREALPQTQLVATPGCYPTSVLLAVAPLLEAGLLDGATIIVDAKSGVSGAGRKAKIGNLYSEINEDLKPYGIGYRHRHAVEMEQEFTRLSQAEKAPRGVVFTPHLLPVTRGILSTIYLPLPSGWNTNQLHALYADRYTDEPFIWLQPPGKSATLRHSVRTNRCAISLHPVPEREQLIIVSTIDNLIKGAAGQAVQNMNVMFGLPETLGLPA